MYLTEVAIAFFLNDYQSIIIITNYLLAKQIVLWL